MTRPHMKAAVLGLVLWLGGIGAARAQNTNQVLGQVNFDGKTNIDKSSGVWVDGQYLGYVDELKGNKKVLLVPGKHEIAVRQVGLQGHHAIDRGVHREARRSSPCGWRRIPTPSMQMRRGR